MTIVSVTNDSGNATDQYIDGAMLLNRSASYCALYVPYQAATKSNCLLQEHDYRRRGSRRMCTGCKDHVYFQMPFYLHYREKLAAQTLPILVILVYSQLREREREREIGFPIRA